MKRIIIAMVLSVLFAAPGFTQAESSHQAQMTSTVAALVAANTVISLTAGSRRITIKLSPGSSSVHLALNSSTTATTSNFLIDSGGAYQYVGEPIKNFAILPNGAVGTVSIQANN